MFAFFIIIVTTVSLSNAFFCSIVSSQIHHLYALSQNVPHRQLFPLKSTTLRRVPTDRRSHKPALLKTHIYTIICRQDKRSHRQLFPIANAPVNKRSHRQTKVGHFIMQMLLVYVSYITNFAVLVSLVWLNSSFKICENFQLVHVLTLTSFIQYMRGPAL